MIEMTGSKSKLSYLSLPQEDPKQRQPDITLASKLLKWHPTVPLREGLGRTIGYFRPAAVGHRPAAHAIRNAVEAPQNQASVATKLPVQKGQSCTPRRMSSIHRGLSTIARTLGFSGGFRGT